MSARRNPHRFTVPQYKRMIDVGILDENDRVELIRGEIVAKMTIGDRHATAVRRLNRLLSDRTRDRAIVDIQNPLQLADSMPEPDVTLLAPRGDFYAAGTPGPADIPVVIEVADASLDDDREVKGPLYAENGIVEYWVVNLVDPSVEVHRRPQASGTYADVRTLRPGDTADVAALPGVTVAVSEIV